MRVLVTGAEGFVGRWLLETLREAGHEVVAAVRPGLTPPRDVPVVRLELTDGASVLEGLITMMVDADLARLKARA